MTLSIAFLVVLVVVMAVLIVVMLVLIVVVSLSIPHQSLTNIAPLASVVCLVQ